MLAIPCDMLVAGYNTDHVNTLRLWDAKSPKPIDMQLFSQGAVPEGQRGRRAMADSISTILYPEDNHYEGQVPAAEAAVFLRVCHPCSPSRAGISRPTAP